VFQCCWASSAIGTNGTLSRNVLMAESFDLAGSIFVNVSAPLLSSQTVILNAIKVSSESPTARATARNSHQKGNTSLIDIDMPLYSASMVEVAISVCNLLDQMTGQLATHITKPVLDLMQLGSCLSS